MTTNRLTLASLSARMDAQDAHVAEHMAALHEDLLALTGIVTRLATNPQAYAPAPVAEVVTILDTKADTHVARTQGRKGETKAVKGAITSGRVTEQDGALLCKSYAVAEALVGEGVLAARLLVPAGKLGQGGWQTYAEATAKRAERAGQRDAYVAERATKRESVVVIDREGTPVSVAAPKAAKDGVLAKPALTYTGAELRDLASNASSKAVRNAAKAEIARRAAKRASVVRVG